MVQKILNAIKFGTVGILVLFGVNAQAQNGNSSSEIDEIVQTLMYYIEGTAHGEPDKLRKAFHPDFNLYSVTKEDSLRIWKGEDYIGRIVPGRKSNRIGKILSIDLENNAAMAKAEILIPHWRVFTDYFLLLKYEGSWKIVHKSYTWQELPKKKNDKNEKQK